MEENQNNLTNTEISVITVEFPRLEAADNRREQLKYPELQNIMDYISNPEQETESQNRGYTVSDVRLYRYIIPDTTNAQLVVPQQQRQTILEKDHDEPTAGHYGSERTFLPENC